MILSRELGKRIWGGSTNTENGGGGVSGDYIAGLLTGYATESWVDEHYISIDFFSRLFQAHGTENGSEIDVIPNDMETTITSVESMFGFWTNLYISALGSNGAAPAGISLGMLTDVVISGTPSAGQVLTFDDVSGMWVNGNAQAGATALANLTDVTISSPQANQALIYNGTSWVNTTLKTVNGYSILGSGDIQVGGGAGNYLPLTGGTMNGSIGEMISIITSNSNCYISFRPQNQYKGAIGYDGGSGYAFWGAGSVGNFARLIFDSNGKLFLGYLTSGDNFTFYKILYDTITDATINGLLTVETIGTNTYRILRHPDISGLVIASSGGSPLGEIGWYIDHFFIGNYSNYTEKSYIAFYNDGQVRIGGGVSNTWRLKIDNFILGKGMAGSEVDTSYSATRMWGIYQWDDMLTINCRDTNNSHLRDAIAISLTNGYVAIGNGFTPSYALHVAGTIYATGSITALSDARKKDITGEADVSVEQIAHAPAVQFLWKDKERRNDGQQVGTLAQYWKTVLPEVVMDKGGELSMQYGVAALVSAIVTARKVVDHERRITELEKENERLKKEVEQLRLN